MFTLVMDCKNDICFGRKHLCWSVEGVCYGIYSGLVVTSVSEFVGSITVSGWGTVDDSALFWCCWCGEEIIGT